MYGWAHHGCSGKNPTTQLFLLEKKSRKIRPRYLYLLSYEVKKNQYLPLSIFGPILPKIRFWR